MKADPGGLIYDEDGRLSCENRRLAHKVLQGSRRELGGHIGFDETEARYFTAIVRNQIKTFEAKKKKPPKKRAKKIEKIVEE